MLGRRLGQGLVPIAPHVNHHLTIGNKDAADTPGGTNGIVPYQEPAT